MRLSLVFNAQLYLPKTKSVHRFQGDQIGKFFKVLGSKNVLYRVAQKVGELLGFFEKHHF